MRFLATFRIVRTLGLAAVTLAAAGPARAQQQLVLFDITYTHTGANDSHHSVGGATLKQPDNWTAPINYANGTIHFYQEVMTKPSKLVTIIDFCFISSGGYGCIETLPYTSTGLNETERSMAAGMHWYQRNQINFTRRVSSIQMVLKDPATYTNGCPNKADCLPSMMRFVATLVPPGATYQRPTPTPGFNPGDAGAAPTPTPDAGMSAPSEDAGAAPPAPDAAVAPPVKADASTTPQPTTPKPDAGATSKPPGMTDPPDDDPTPPTGRKASSGCSYGGRGSAGLGGLLLVVLLAGRRRR